MKSIFFTLTLSKHMYANVVYGLARMEGGGTPEDPSVTAEREKNNVQFNDRITRIDQLLLENKNNPSKGITNLGATTMLFELGKQTGHTDYFSSFEELDKTTQYEVLKKIETSIQGGKSIKEAYNELTTQVINAVMINSRKVKSPTEEKPEAPNF